MRLMSSATVGTDCWNRLSLKSRCWSFRGRCIRVAGTDWIRLRSALKIRKDGCMVKRDTGIRLQRQTRFNITGAHPHSGTDLMLFPPTMNTSRLKALLVSTGISDIKLSETSILCKDGCASMVTRDVSRFLAKTRLLRRGNTRLKLSGKFAIKLLK